MSRVCALTVPEKGGYPQGQWFNRYAYFEDEKLTCAESAWDPPCAWPVDSATVPSSARSSAYGDVQPSVLLSKVQPVGSQ